MTERRGKEIIAIDLLRFVCAMLVLGYHYLSEFPALRGERVPLSLAGTPPLTSWWPAQAGSIGVELFFVISGVVIARSALDRRWTSFLRQRVLRLAPAAWICATLTLVVLTLAGQGDAALVGDWGRSLRFWPIGRQIDASYWTLGVELSFYLIVALAVGAHGERRRIARVGDAIGLASIAFWVVCLISGATAQLMTNQAAILLLLPHGCLFALGMRIGTGRAKGVLFGALCLAALVEVAAHLGGGRETLIALLGQAIFAGGVALLLVADRVQPWLAQRIDGATARSIGLMTYPLYLLHQDVGAVAIGALQRIGAPGWVAVALTVALMLAAAWTIAAWMEPMLREALGRVIPRRRAVSPARGPARDTRPNASLPTG
jgi:peptidoglycan/LPS O-acetylase OafA/YrhL